MLAMLVLMPAMVVLSFSMPVTVLIWAIWLVAWALSMGLSGSWFCICVTRSLRKRSCASAFYVDLLPVAAEVALLAAVLLVTAVLMISFLVPSAGSCSTATWPSS